MVPREEGGGSGLMLGCGGAENRREDSPADVGRDERTACFANEGDEVFEADAGSALMSESYKGPEERSEGFGGDLNPFRIDGVEASSPVGSTVLGLTIVVGFSPLTVWVNPSFHIVGLSGLSTAGGN